MNEIKIKIPTNFTQEKNYIIDFIFTDILGIEYVYYCKERSDYIIELPNGKSIIIKDDFFGRVRDDYVKINNIPNRLDTVDYGSILDIPVIFGENKINTNENSIYCGIDIVASIFFMLSRWEEVAISEKDEHGRFPGKLSLAVKENFIDRPIVNEYIFCLRLFIERLDSSVIMKENENRITLTSDIDEFRKYSNFNILKELAGDLLKRHSLKEFYRNFREYMMKFLINSKDPYNTFEELIELSELTTEKPMFFIPVSDKSIYDSGWFRNKDFSKTAEFIQEHGGEIELHYGYNSMNSAEKIKTEKELLEKTLNLKVNSARAHFLRFNIDQLFDDFENLGIIYDYSLGYSKCAGFRCGTSYAFKPWNFKNRKQYDIEVHPLIVMDATLYIHNNANEKEISEFIKRYKNTIEKFGGNLILLLHNSSPKVVFNAFKNGLQ